MKVYRIPSLNNALFTEDRIADDVLEFQNTNGQNGLDPTTPVHLATEQPAEAKPIDQRPELGYLFGRPQPVAPPQQPFVFNFAPTLNMPASTAPTPPATTTPPTTTTPPATTTSPAGGATTTTTTTNATATPARRPVWQTLLGIGVGLFLLLGIVYVATMLFGTPAFNGGVLGKASAVVADVDKHGREIVELKKVDDKFADLFKGQETINKGQQAINIDLNKGIGEAKASANEAKAEVAKLANANSCPGGTFEACKAQTKNAAPTATDDMLAQACAPTCIQ